MASSELNQLIAALTANSKPVAPQPNALLAALLAPLPPEPQPNALSVFASLVPSSPATQPNALSAFASPRNRLLPAVQTADEYLQGILKREAVNTGLFSPVYQAQNTIRPVIEAWAGDRLLSLSPSGSFMKGTANKSGTDIDLFISITSHPRETLKDIYNSLDSTLKANGYATKRQNVSININVNGESVDLVPATQQNALTGDHSLYRRKAGTWTKTNVMTHAGHVQLSGRTDEIRVLKLWRNQHGLDFPSFYLELTVINALNTGLFNRAPYGKLSENIATVLRHIRDNFASSVVIDPANTNNRISDDLTVAEKAAIVRAATNALSQTWDQFVK